MENEHFGLSGFAYVIVGVIWIFSIGALLYVIDNSPGKLDFSSNWAFIILIVGLYMSPSLIMTWSLIVEKTTIYSKTGIERWTVLGRKKIKWSEVEALEKSIFYLAIKFQNGKFYLPLLLYKNSNFLVEFIKNQLSHLLD